METLLDLFLGEVPILTAESMTIEERFSVPLRCNVLGDLRAFTSFRKVSTTSWGNVEARSIFRASAIRQAESRSRSVVAVVRVEAEFVRKRTRFPSSTATWAAKEVARS